MPNRKLTNQYYFTVEGETEQWYLLWLQDLINSTEQSTYRVAFNCSIQKRPDKRAKSLKTLETGRKKVEIYHLCDYESGDPQHVKNFTDAMDNMKKANESGKNIAYQFGYSNFTFELWMILHRADCYGGFIHRDQYIKPLNNAYNTHFENLDAYKHEDSFNHCLSTLTLAHVRDAVERAKTIMKRNVENGYTLQQYKGYTYYKENPALAVWQPIESILKDCTLL